MSVKRGRWRLTRLGLGLLALIAAPFGIAATRSDEPKQSDMIVHEWGTFLAMNGSDGVGLEGMYHEEHALPNFVHARSRDQLRLPSVSLKGETPVIYFYTDRAQEARVEVKFPGGIWTQWYPQAQIVGPQFAQVPRAGDLRDGRIVWCADIIPASTPGVTIPDTSSDALWNHAREVDAAYVQTPDRTKGRDATETERFLFYRGLGRAKMPLGLSADKGGTLSLPKGEKFGVAHLFILKVEDGKGSYAYRPALRPGETLTGVMPSDGQAKPMEQFTVALADDLAARLVESGLYAKEARAMVNTWRSSYFQTPGVRVLFVLPQAWTDAFIPMTITPIPKKTVRVMVGRTELLTPEREGLAEEAIRDLGSGDSGKRQEAFAYLQRQGRYVEPIVRRVLNSSADEQVKATCRQLLSAEFVTELRAALGHAAKAPRNTFHDDPVFVRAQLAALLREIGRTAEAEVEGKLVREALRGMPAPAIHHAEFRGYARAQVRAAEAVGDAKAAGEWYDQFVTFGSQTLARNECKGCHRDGGPMDTAWFRSWWAGPRYASSVASGEGLDKAVARLSGASADKANRLRLVYLLEAQGKKSEAEQVWRELGDHATLSAANR